MHVYVCLGLFTHRTFWKKELTVVIYGKKKVGGGFEFYLLHPIPHFETARTFARKS